MTLAEWCRKCGVFYNDKPSEDCPPHLRDGIPISVPPGRLRDGLNFLSDYMPSSDPKTYSEAHVWMVPRRPAVIGPNDIRIANQYPNTTRELMRAVLIYVARDSEPDSYCPDDMLMFRRAFAGDPDAVSYCVQMLINARS